MNEYRARPDQTTLAVRPAMETVSRAKAPTSELAKVLNVPSNLRGLAYYEDGILYVSQDEVFTSKVYAFEASLRRQKLLKEKRPVSIAEIKLMQERSTAEPESAARDGRRALARIRELFARATAMRATDIRLQIFKDSHCVVQYRIDGYQRIVMELLPDVAISMVTALYNIADGKNQGEWKMSEICFARIKDPEIIPPSLSAVRFSSTRTNYGALIALRLLPKEVVKAGSLTTIGFSDQQIETLKEMLRSSSGLVLISGPTGAGKSTSLKYGLEWLYEETPYYTTITVEDPTEYPIKGSDQIDVLIQDNEDPSVDQRSKAWATVLATTLRLDPDRLMISEIRDGAAAIAGFRAAQTGHLTLSTIHTNDGWETINRLVDLLREGGMLNPMALLANTKNFVGSTAQRLVPTLCGDCKISLKGHERRVGGKEGRLYCELAAAVDSFEARSAGVFIRGDGCNSCVPEFKDNPQAQRSAPGAGIYGRTVVAEIIRPTQHHLDIALAKGTPAARRQWLEDGGQLMIDHALVKVMNGEVSPEVVGEFVGSIVSSRQEIEAYRKSSPGGAVVLSDIRRSSHSSLSV